MGIYIQLYDEEACFGVILLLSYLPPHPSSLTNMSSIRLGLLIVRRIFDKPTKTASLSLWREGMSVMDQGTAYSCMLRSSAVKRPLTFDHLKWLFEKLRCFERQLKEVTRRPTDLGFVLPSLDRRKFR